MGRIASTDNTALNKRNEFFADAQEHYYRAPPVMERGYQQYLYDRFGRAYLDMVNNVAVVGHSHGAVISAAVRQLKLLNTNSRFVYELLGQFTERIVDTIPRAITEQGGLNVVFLVNSGSEATDLALRISRSVVTERRRKLSALKNIEIGDKDSVPAFQLNRDVICLEGAYHGVTTASDEVSTTLNDNPK
jgi:4-aminobutyrate aminotransferase-like enzyme